MKSSEYISVENWLPHAARKHLTNQIAPPAQKNHGASIKCQQAIVDAAVLGAMYSTGMFAELSLPPDAIAFRFFADTTRVVLMAATCGNIRSEAYAEAPVQSQ